MLPVEEVLNINSQHPKKLIGNKFVRKRILWHELIVNNL
jgi:hypothetical protein